MAFPWDILGLSHAPNREDDIHAAYEAKKSNLTKNGDLTGQLSLEGLPGAAWALEL